MTEILLQEAVKKAVSRGAAAANPISRWINLFEITGRVSYAIGEAIGSEIARRVGTPADPDGHGYNWPEGWNGWTEYYPDGVPPDEFPHNGLEGAPYEVWWFTPNVGPVYGTAPATAPDYSTAPVPDASVHEMWENYFSTWYSDNRSRSMRARSWNPEFGTVQNPEPAGAGVRWIDPHLDLSTPELSTPVVDYSEQGEPVQAVEPSPTTLPATVIVGVPGTRPAQRTQQEHRLRPPGRREKERKVIANVGARSLVGIAMNAVTETGDFIDALWEAIPRSKMPQYFRRTKKGKYVWKRGVLRRLTIQQKAMDVYRHLGDIDVANAVHNVAVNQLEDKIIGKLSKKAQQGARPWLELLQRPVGWGTGPAM